MTIIHLLLTPLKRYALAFLMAISFSFAPAFLTSALADGHIPNLLGKWSGANNTVSKQKGYKTWDKTIHITEQKDRRFKGYFTYAEGRKDFFGVIFPDNKSFTWVVPNSRGYNHGRILGKDSISACYIESGIDATAGCAEMKRQ